VPQPRGELPDFDNVRRDIVILRLTYDDANASTDHVTAVKRRKMRLAYPSLASAGDVEEGREATTVGYGIPGRSSQGGCAYDTDEIEPCEGAFCEPDHIAHRRFASTPITALRDPDPFAPISYAADGSCPMPAPGDSGAPLFGDRDGRLIAVLSATNATPTARCSATAAFYVNVTAPPIRDWLQTVLRSFDADSNGTPDACDVDDE